ncbi:MAG: FkbM family methyltransferase, partial [Gemmatimonadaceae bacterium]
PRLFVDMADHVIGLNIVRGGYERDEIAFVRSVVAPGDTVVDIGAHIGFFTMQLASMVGPAGRVFAFEPFDANADLLERSIAENRFGDRIVFTRAAVGASSGTAALTFPPETLNSGGAYLLRAGSAALPGNLTKEVPVIALDDAPLTRPVRFIKMDVEGAEPRVVAGAQRILREDRPLILSELHPTQLERASAATAGGFLQQMRTLGYAARTIDGAPLEHAPADAVVSLVLVPVGSRE